VVLMVVTLGVLVVVVVFASLGGDELGILDCSSELCLLSIV